MDTVSALVHVSLTSETDRKADYLWESYMQLEVYFYFSIRSNQHAVVL